MRACLFFFSGFFSGADSRVFACAVIKIFFFTYLLFFYF